MNNFQIDVVFMYVVISTTAEHDTTYVAELFPRCNLDTCMVMREVVVCARIEVYDFLHGSDGRTNGFFWSSGNRQPRGLNLHV